VGIIAKQTVKGSIYTYAGVFLGFIGTGILMPKFFTTEQVGLTTVLISVTLLFSQFATLGFASVNTRIFPYFRNNENGHNGLLLLGILVTLTGFIVSIILLYVFKKPILTGKSGESDMITAYTGYFIPLVFFTVYFLFFDSYSKSLFDSVIGTFLRDFLVKLLNLGLIILYVIDYINFNSFVLGYVTIYILPTIIIVIILIQRKQLKIAGMNPALIQAHKKEIVKVSFYGIMAGFSGIAVVNIDTIVTNMYLGLSLSGIYGIVYFIATLVTISSKSLRKISSIVIAEAWKKEDISTIQTIYSKSTINQLIIGVLIFGGIYINLNNLFYVIPEYVSGKNALILLLIGFMIEMFSGVSGIIISGSKYYKYFSIQSFISIITLVLFCMVLIPIYGIIGTAIAVSLNYFIFAVIRFVFLYKRFELQPYGMKHILIIIFGAGALFIDYLIPSMSRFEIDFLVRSSIFTCLFLIPTIIFKTSPEINEMLVKLFDRFRKPIIKN
jgi:O-antigen/teichoic acid export membrane protein